MRYTFDQPVVTVLMRCRDCERSWRWTAGEFLRHEQRPPGVTCKCGSRAVDKVSVDRD